MSNRLAKKVLLIGWDAADWQMIRPLIDSGRMPTLAKFIEAGVSGNLSTVHPILSPMLWNSIATGKRADKHGIHGFVEPLPDGSGIRPVSSTSRKTKAIWNMLSQSGFASNVVGWFASHPAEPIRGTIVTDHFLHQTALCGPPDQFPQEVCHPERLRTPLLNLRVNPLDLDAQAILPFVPQAAKVDLAKDPRIGELASLLARTASVHAAACAVMAKEPWDFMAVYYDAIDQFGHHFMPYHPPHVAGISAADAEIYQDVMVGCYCFHDMMLETLLNQAGEETTVILVSDHGFLSDGRRSDADGFKNPTAWHRQHGIVCAKGPGIKRGDSLYGASLLDVTPTILSLFGLPTGRDMDGRPWLEVFDRVIDAAQIDSWDDLAGDCGSHADDRQEDPLAELAVLQRLAALGYIDSPAEDVQTTIRNTTIDLRTNLAIALVDGGKIAAAIEVWEEVIRLAGSDADLVRSCRGEVARCLMQLGRFDECEQILHALRAEAPHDAMALLRLAQLQLRVGQAARALEQLSELPADVASSSASHALHGQAYLQLRRFADAENAFAAVLETDREHAEAWGGLAEAALGRRDYLRACECALEAVALEHRLPAAHLTLGVALAESGRSAEAIHAFRTVLQLAPGIAVAQAWLAKLDG
jgi:tetratricopeptide (TPR) repeat protein